MALHKHEVSVVVKRLREPCVSTLVPMFVVHFCNGMLYHYMYLRRDVLMMSIHGRNALKSNLRSVFCRLFLSQRCSTITMVFVLLRP